MVGTRTATLATLILLAAPLAGCIGQDDPAPSNDEEQEPMQATDNGTDETFPDPSPSTDPDEDDASPQRRVLSYGNLDGPYNQTIHHEGSFGTHESCLGGGCAATATTGDAPYEEHVDITAEAPTHVPVRVTVNVTHGGDFGSFYAFVTGEETTVYDYASGYEATQGSGHAWASALVVLDAASELTAGVGSNLADPPNQDYQMAVTLKADPLTVPAHVPVAVDLTPRDVAPLLQTGPDANDSTLRVWGPDDEVLRHASGLGANQTIALNASTSGEHVIAATAPDLLLAASSEIDASLRALTLETILGDPNEPDEEGMASWEPTVDVAPYTAGIYAQGEGPAYSYQDIELELSSPNGTVLSGEFFGSSCLVCPDGSLWYWFGERLDEDMVPGQWAAEVSVDQQVNVRVGHVIVHFER